VRLTRANTTPQEADMKAPVLIPLVAAASLAFAFGATAQESIMSVPSGTMVEMSGKVAGIEGTNLIVDGPSSTVRVHMYNRIDWYEPYEKNARDALRVGDPVTVYGRLDNNREMPKIEADAVYVPSFNRMFVSEQKAEIVDINQDINRFNRTYYVPIEG
jgi:hypothetical protein